MSWGLVLRSEDGAENRRPCPHEADILIESVNSVKYQNVTEF